MLGLVADMLDRRADLLRMYWAADDDALRVKLSAELRLLEQLARSPVEAGQDSRFAAGPCRAR